MSAALSIVPDEIIEPGDATATSVDLDLAAKRLATLIDGDAWQSADVLVEVFPPSEYGDADHGDKTGIRKAFDRLHSRLLVEYGVDLSTSTMRLYRATAIKWPEDTRVSSASFTAHRLLKGEDRYERMAKYLKLAEREGRALSASMVKRYRDDEKPRQVRTMREVMRRRITTAVKGVLAEGIIKSSLPDPDWWNGKKITDPQREMAVEELRRLADMIEGLEVDDG